ncbi:MAG TPA: endonuclease/exonuclease/phosphatase family protein [Kofleriaceae bacterium]
MASRLRVMTYNMHSGRGTDDRYDIGRIAEVIGSYNPDIVALQEVDVGRLRSGAIDQATELGARLGLDVHFAPAIERGGERYGIATLTRLPTVEVRKISLPNHTHLRTEPRCALATRHRWDGGELEMINTHLSTLFRERPQQVAALIEAFAFEAVVIAGDFNMTPLSAAYRLLRRGMRSATWMARTWPSYAPIAPIDHILYRGRLRLIHGEAWRGGPAREASDHLPVVAELQHLEAAA